MLKRNKNNMLHKLLSGFDKRFTFKTSQAHCDIPCKIYDPIEIQVAVLTIIRTTDLLMELNDKESKTPNDEAQFSSAGWKNTLDDFDKSLRINASALFKITQLFSEDMKKNNSGSIINIGSMMGTVGVENGNYEGTDFTPATSPLYFYEKGGMHNFTRWAASMLGPFNIRVNCLAPGGFQVPAHPQRFVENYSKRTQLGRMANSSDLKGPIIFLASDSSAYLTGTIIAVDGGYTAK